MRARAALVPDAKCADRQVDVVIEHDQVFHGALIKMQNALHAVAGEVHIGRGFDQHESFAAVKTFAVHAGKAAFGHFKMQGVRQHVQRLKARVMARALVEQTGVAQPDDDMHEKTVPLEQIQPILARFRALDNKPKRVICSLNYIGRNAVKPVWNHMSDDGKSKPRARLHREPGRGESPAAQSGRTWLPSS